MHCLLTHKASNSIYFWTSLNNQFFVYNIDINDFLIDDSIDIIPI